MTSDAATPRPGADCDRTAELRRATVWRARSVLACRRGATAVEYGLISALVALAISAAVFALGADLRDLFLGTSSEIMDATDTDDTTDAPEADGNTNGGFVIIRPGGNVSRE